MYRCYVVLWRPVVITASFSSEDLCVKSDNLLRKNFKKIVTKRSTGAESNLFLFDQFLAPFQKCQIFKIYLRLQY